MPQTHADHIVTDSLFSKAQEVIANRSGNYPRPFLLDAKIGDHNNPSLCVDTMIADFTNTTSAFHRPKVHGIINPSTFTNGPTAR